MMQRVQKTVENPRTQSTNRAHFQFSDGIFDVPVVMQRQVPTMQSVQKIEDVSQVQRSEQVVEVPIRHVTVNDFHHSTCAGNRRGATEAAHFQSRRDVSCDLRQVPV